MSVGENSVLAAGTIVADRYRIESLLGEGGMGLVYLAEHVHIRKRVALKVLLPEFSKSPEVVARFEREAIAAGNVAHPNVVAATDFGRLDDGSFFLVLEYIAGRTLRAALADGAMDVARALKITRGIAAAVGAAHAKGIVHRDLKPENVMLIERDGDPDFVKVLDFGVAKLEMSDGATGPQKTGLTKVGMIIGTPDYMSPEQAVGQAIDLRTDLYSIGVILYELLAGRCPFQGGAATVIRMHLLTDAPPLPDARAIDPRVASIVRRLLEKSPAARYANAMDLIAAIDHESQLSHRVHDVAAVSSSFGGITTPSLAHAPTALGLGPGGQMPAAPRAQLLRLAWIGAALAVGFAILVVAMVRKEPSRDAQESGEATNAVMAASALPPPPAPSALKATVTPAPEAPSAASPSSSGSAASTSSAKPTPDLPKPQGGKKRRTGPGGIYVPPPSQWFK